MVANLLYYQKEDNAWGCESSTWSGRVPCRSDVWQIFFWLQSEVTTKGSCSLFLYYDHLDSITRNTQLLCSCWLSRSDIPEIFPERDNHSISLELY